MRVKLLSFTPNPDSVVYAAARCCYDDVDMTDESYNLVVTKLTKLERNKLSLYDCN